MDIENMIQSNCSESVFQICGINLNNREEYKELLFATLCDKYTERYLEEYLTGLLAIEDFYCLNLTDEIDGYDDLSAAAKQMNGVYDDCVSHCSDPITTEEEMKSHMAWREGKGKEND